MVLFYEDDIQEERNRWLAAGEIKTIHAASKTSNGRKPDVSLHTSRSRACTKAAAAVRNPPTVRLNCPCLKWLHPKIRKKKLPQFTDSGMLVVPGNADKNERNEGN
jgi:hypothetical protein